ncbi:MAG: hypothetical protein KBC05_14880 [Candidatus Hydrogenedentes bacterium]|nr:hypothetical protein [Candidatus Hydrogenedentota bacterium]
MSEGIQINARAPAPADLIRAIGRALDPIAAGLGLDVVLSDTAFDALDALADAPGGGRVVVAWRGDDNRAGLPGGHGGVAFHEIAIAVTTGRDLSPERAPELVCMEALAKIRKAVLGLRFRPAAGAQPSMDDRLAYERTRPIIAPSGIPTEAFEMTFTVRAALPMPDDRAETVIVTV